MIASSRIRALCLLGLLLSGTATAQADLVITIGSVTIPAGGTGTVDVMISTNGGTQQLAAYGFEFVITPNLGTTTQLEFVDPQSSSELNDPTYVFYPSGGVQPTPIGNVGNGVEYIGANISNNVNGETVTTTEQLLVRLDLTAITGNAPIPGDTFTITLVTPDIDTFFYDENGDDIPFTANTGIITMGASTVPEPGSLLLAGLAFSGLGVFQLRRRKSQMPIAN